MITNPANGPTVVAARKGTGVEPVPTVPSARVAETERVKVVPTRVGGAVEGTVSVAVRPSEDATTGALVKSVEVHVGTIPAGKTTTFP